LNISQISLLPKDSLYTKGRRLAVQQTDSSNREALILFKACLIKCKAEKDSLLLAKSYHLAAYCLERTDFTQSMLFLDSAVVVYKALNVKNFLDCLNYQGYLYTEKGRFDEAIKVFQQCIEDSRAFNSPENESICLSELGYTYDRLKNYQRSIELNRQALVLTKDSIIKGRIYGMIGIAYDELMQYDSALFYNRKAIDLFQKNNAVNFETIWLSNLGNTLVKIGKYEEALEVLRKAELNNLAAGSKSSVLSANIGRALMETNNIREAKNYLNDALEIAKITENKRSEEEAEFLLSQWFERIQDYESALVHYKIHTQIKDSLYQLETVREAEELQVKYESVTKDKLISDKELEIERKNVEVQQSNFRNLILGILVLLAAAFSYFIYRVQVQKRRRAKAENEQRIIEQKLSLSKELHDNIGSQITFMIHSIEGIAYQSKEGKSKLKLMEVSDFGREVMDDLRNTVWVMKQEQGDLNTLHAKLLEIKSKTGESGVEVRELSGNAVLSAVQLLNLHRIALEAIQNALKYAKAQSIGVSLQVVRDKVILMISDNGKGFDLEEANQGNGLLNMKSRAESIAAKLTISSTLGTGTTIKVELPLI